MVHIRDAQRKTVSVALIHVKMEGRAGRLLAPTFATVLLDGVKKIVDEASSKVGQVSWFQDIVFMIFTLILLTVLK